MHENNQQCQEKQKTGRPIGGRGPTTYCSISWFHLYLWILTVSRVDADSLRQENLLQTLPGSFSQLSCLQAAGLLADVAESSGVFFGDVGQALLGSSNVFFFFWRPNCGIDRVVKCSSLIELLTPPEQVLNLDSAGLSMYETASEATILSTHRLDVLDVLIPKMEMPELLR